VIFGFWGWVFDGVGFWWRFSGVRECWAKLSFERGALPPLNLSPAGKPQPAVSLALPPACF
jgi:hypothetical protein